MAWLRSIHVSEGVPLPSRLYHYTDQAGLVGIIRDRVIYATDLRFVNDRTEYQHAVDIANRRLQGEWPEKHARIMSHLSDILETSAAYMARAVYITSFSERDDDLNQWRAYSSRGSGFCIGFETSALSQAASGSWRLSQCIYDGSGKAAKIDRIFELIVTQLEERGWPLDELYVADKLGDALLDEIADVAPLLKDAAFVSEAEWRLWQAHVNEELCWRPGPHAPVPFVKVHHATPEIRSIASIRIGPSADHQLVRLAVAGLLEQAYGHRHGIEITASEVPFRG